MRPSLYEDGTNVAIGTKFIAERGGRVLPWYDPAEGKAPSDWKEKWKKLRDRFEKIIDEGCKMECFLIHYRIPQSKAGHQKYPGVLQGRKKFLECNGLRIEPSNLLSPTWEPLVGLFPFNSIRGEPMLNSQNQPVAFRLGLSHHFIVCHEIGLESDSLFHTGSQLMELAKDATNLIYQLPPEIACWLWRNFPSGFSKMENADHALWFDALFQISLQQHPGGPLFARRYDWEDNGYIGLIGDGLFPRLPDFDGLTSLDPPKVPKDEDYPMAYYAKLPDLARASVAAIDEILQRGAMSFKQGQRFGDWTLLGDKAVGAGGNGVVWQCQKPGDIKGAIKFFNREDIRRRFPDKPDELVKREKRFRDEVVFLTREARRSGILPLLDSYLMYQPSPNDVLWFVMPWADPFPKLSGGENLHELVSKFQVIATTLAELHAGEKWHRDIHPGNLFLYEGKPVIGDFGLVDYPDKEPITGEDERIGARNYVAPELREYAEHTRADKADVYSLAKCFWVLATGKSVPPDHPFRRETPALKISTHCPHKYAESLDALMERSTEFDPALRPSMSSFAAELSEWLKLETASSPSEIDLSALAKECRGVIETKLIAERAKDNRVKEAGAVSAGFDPTFDLMHKQILEVTGLTPERMFLSYQNKTGHREVSQGADVISKFGREIKAVIKIGPIEIFLRGCTLFEVLNDGRIHVVAGFSDHPLFPLDRYAPNTWKKEIVAPIGSAQLINEVELLKKEFLENLPKAIQVFMFRIKSATPTTSL
jgi:serine/threonine protein kinase